MIDDLLRMRSGIADPFDQAFLSFYFHHRFADFDAEAMIRRGPPRGPVHPAGPAHGLHQRQLFDPGADRREGYRPHVRRPDREVYPEAARPAAHALPDRHRAAGAVARLQLRRRDRIAFLGTTRLNPAVPGGAGAMISTVGELHAYVRAICKGRLLKPNTRRARLRVDRIDGSPEFVGYGEGIAHFGRFCGHNGTITGFSSEMFYLPERDATIVVNVNRLDEDNASKSTDLFLILTKILFPRLVDW
jgi:D-alanyl-D-alanine carboxypeptidase